MATRAAGSTTALAALARACDASAAPLVRPTEPAACVFLGLIAAAGEGVPRDPSRAVAYLERGARCDLSFGAEDLVEVQSDGLDEHDSSCCSGRACPAHCADACRRASEQIDRELDPPLRDACAAGRGSACFLLAQLTRGEYAQDIGSVPPAARGATPSAERTAAALRRSACQGGLGLACGTDRGCDLDWGPACLGRGNEARRQGRAAEAYRWWDRACSLGMSHVCDDVKQLRASGSFPGG